MPSRSILLATVCCALAAVGCSSGPDDVGISETLLSSATLPGGGPILVHTYNKNANDVSGNALHGVIYGDPKFRASCIDRAIVVDGQGDYVRIPFDGSMEPDVVTLEVYFRPKNVLMNDAGFLPIVVKMPHNGNFWNTVDGYDLWYQDSGVGGRIGFGIGDANGTLRPNVSWWGTMTPNKYYHIVGTYDGSEMRLYIDGDLVGLVLHSNPIAYRGGPIWVGGHVRHSYYGSGYHDFEGSIDEVAVYDYVMSADEVRARAQRCPRTGSASDDDPHHPHEARR